MIRKIISHIRNWYYHSSNERFCAFLKSKGVLIGGGTFIDPKTSVIDVTRPSLVSIGSNCYMNRNFTLLTHDWVTHVFIHAGLNFINSSGKVTIGNNVSFGQNVMVLKGVTIGDNVFIGAGSIVTKDIPSNCIAVGQPCKAIMTLDEYYEKRIKKSREEAFEYARSIVERFNRAPVLEDFWEEFPLFVSGKDVGKYPTLPIKRQLGPVYERYVKEHIAEFENFEAFLLAAKVKYYNDETKTINN